MSTHVERLTAHIREHGPIGTVRVSSAKARGWAKRYSYWGAVRYEIRLTRDGVPSAYSAGRARSDHRSESLAHEDAARLAEREGRLAGQWRGRLTEAECEDVLSRVQP